VYKAHKDETAGIILRVLDEDPASRTERDIRFMAAEALGNFDRPEAKERLRKMAAEDPDVHVRLEAAKSLEKLGEPRPQVAPARDLPGPVHPLGDEYLKSPDGRYTAVLSTNRGEIEIELLNQEAPRTVQNFVELAEKGFYDRLTFHRVVPNFVIQTGCPLGNGWGNPGHEMRCETSPLRFERGVVGMAHAGKDTGGSQFFITHSRAPHLDGRYTIFGRVTRGMEIVDTIEVEDQLQSVKIKKAPL
jgi:cyclophilin family peptidyl-prolyl cis-trans isomerase